MKKILYIENEASIDSVNFYICAALAARNLGIEFHLAYNAADVSKEKIEKLKKSYGVIFHQVDFRRNPFNIANFKAYKQINRIIREEDIDAIHCNTPIGGVVGRLAGKRCGITPVIYQAHGFHFYKGAPLFNWLFYYPIERWLAHYTDALITINHEDYELAQKFHLRNQGSIYYVPGVGINTSAFEPRYKIRKDKRLELGLNKNDIAIISAGDLIERKNYKTSIEAVAGVENIPLHYFICGQGPQRYKLEMLTQKLKIADRVHFLGFRSDVKEIFQAADIFLFTSLQEGLSRSLMEAMASGLPCIVSKIRGNTDILNENSEYLIDAKDVRMFVKKLKLLADSIELRKELGLANMLRVREFSIDVIQKNFFNLYQAKQFVRNSNVESYAYTQ